MSSHLSLDNTEIIINSVIILFVCHLDELLYGILKTFPRLLSRLSQGGQDEFDIDFRQNYWDAIKRQQEGCSMARLTDDVHRLIEKVKLLEEHCPDLNICTDLALLS